jgi:diguanylate cyclase (GGDEF)-like protein
VNVQPLHVLWVASEQPPPAIDGVRFEAAPELRDGAHDALVWVPEDRSSIGLQLAQHPWDSALQSMAVLLVAPGLSADDAQECLLRGAQDVLESTEPTVVARALRHAVARKHREKANQRAYATDLATGLPHEAQLVEHINQLLALREREPAPMVLIALRVQGLHQAAGRLGEEAAAVLRRKVAVRLRGGLRAGDVVASTGPDSFAVLLGHVEAASDGERVLAKIVRTIEAPTQVAGQPFALRVSAGLACYPQHGRGARELLQRATAQAAAWAPLGGAGVAEMGTQMVATPANDDDGR